MKKRLISIALLLLFWAAPSFAQSDYVDGWLGDWVVEMKDGSTVSWNIDETWVSGSGMSHLAYGIKSPGDVEFMIYFSTMVNGHMYIEKAHTKDVYSLPQDLSQYTELIPTPDPPADFESFTAEEGPYPIKSGERKVIVAPVIAQIADQTILSGSAYTGPTPVLVAGSDVTWSLDAGPDGMTINATTGVVSWASPVTDVYDITVKAENEVGSDTVTWQLTVTDEADPPVIKEIADETISVGAAYSLQPELESGTSPVVWSLEVGPEGMTIDASSGEIAWENPVEGTYDITIKAENDGGSDTESFELTVEVIPPVIEDIADAEIQEGVAYSVTAKLVSGTTPVTWALKHGPTGMTIGEETGVVSWASPVAGEHLVEITATNDGGTDEADWLLTVVKDTPPGPCAAAYLLGAEDPRLDILREFRDQKMAASQSGNDMISMYYEKSEDIIAICETSPVAKWSFKAMLEAIIPVIQIML